MTRDPTPHLAPGTSGVRRRPAAGAAVMLAALAGVAAATTFHRLPGGSVASAAGTDGTVTMASAARRAGHEAQVAPAPVRTFTPEWREVIDYPRSYLGRVEAVRQPAVGFERDGQLVALMVDEGEPVAAGAVLARLDTDRLAAQRREYVAERDRALANADLARATRTRVQAINARGLESKQRLDEASEALSVARAELELAEARIARLDVELEKSVVAAPFAATVLERHRDEGDVVAAGTPVFTLMERGRLQARVGVTGQPAAVLEAGAVVDLTVAPAAVGRARSLTVAARVREIIPRRSQRFRTVDVLFDLDPQAAAAGIKPGDRVELLRATELEERGFWAPVAALRAGERGLWTVLVADADHGDGLAERAGEATASGARARLEPYPVTVLHQEATRAYVTGPLPARALVVAGGLQQLVPRQVVEVVGHDARLAGRGAAANSNAEATP